MDLNDCSEVVPKLEIDVQHRSKSLIKLETEEPKNVGLLETRSFQRNGNSKTPSPSFDSFSSEGEGIESARSIVESETSNTGRAFSSNTSTGLPTNRNSNASEDKEQVEANDSLIDSKCHLHAFSESLCITLPKVNCPEKIILCLDLNEEMDTTTFRSKSGDKYSGLELGKRAIRMFVLHKSQMNPKHEFAFLIFHEDSTMIQSFTSRTQEILMALDDIIETQKSGPLNLSHLYETVKDNIHIPPFSEILPPPYVVRVVLVFGRSHSIPVKASTEAKVQLESWPYFFTDVLYIHEPPTEDNQCEEIFRVLCELDHNGLSYIFEQSKYTPILNSGAKLLAHPLQRPKQLEAKYKLEAIRTEESSLVK